MNKIFLKGNLCKDPEYTETANKTPLTRFNLAVRRDYKNADGEYDVDFFNCSAWRTQAETINKYCKKGDPVLIVGSVQFRNYEDKDDNKRVATDVIVKEIEFLSKKDSGNETESKPTQQKEQPKIKPMLPKDDDFLDDSPF